MTDLEIMQHAKEYLDKLARGIDPLTGPRAEIRARMEKPGLRWEEL